MADGPLLTVAGLVLLWPFLFVVPGWVVVRRVAPDLPIPGAVGVAVVSSVYLSAHLVDLVARLTGFGPSAVIGSVLLLAVGDRRRGPGGPPLARAVRTTDARRRPGDAAR